MSQGSRSALPAERSQESWGRGCLRASARAAAQGELMALLDFVLEQVQVGLHGDVVVEDDPRGWEDLRPPVGDCP